LFPEFIPEGFRLTITCANYLPIFQNTSVYFNPYTQACYEDTQTQVDFLATTFAESTATWKFLQLHHPYMSSAANETELEPLIDIVIKHSGIVLNGHDHCLAHYYNNNTNFILSGAAGYPQVGDCNYGVPLGPYALFLGANEMTGMVFDFCMLTLVNLPTAANGFVTMDISSQSINVEYYVRDMQFENGDLYPVPYDLNPSYSFQITEHST